MKSTTIQGLRQGPPETCMCFESSSTIWDYSYSRVQQPKGGNGTTITPSDPLQKKKKCFYSATLCSADQGILVPEQGVLLPRGTANTPLNCKLRLLPGHFGLLMPSVNRLKKVIAERWWPTSLSSALERQRQVDLC